MYASSCKRGIRLCLCWRAVIVAVTSFPCEGWRSPTPSCLVTRHVVSVVMDLLGSRCYDWSITGHHRLHSCPLSLVARLSPLMARPGIGRTISPALNFSLLENYRLSRNFYPKNTFWTKIFVLGQFKGKIKNWAFVMFCVEILQHGICRKIAFFAPVYFFHHRLRWQQLFSQKFF